MFGSPFELATPMVKTIYRAEYRLLADFLRERRERLGLSQTALAEQLGWTQQKVSFVEAGARRIDVVEYIHLSRALGVSPAAAFRQAEKLALAKNRT